MWRRRPVTPTAAPVAADGPLILADISGYTSFLQNVSESHRTQGIDVPVPDAYPLVSMLLDGIVGKLIPPFTLSKIEGDAVFAFATDADGMPRSDALLACMAGCYAAFRDALGVAQEGATCRCAVCTRLEVSLDLKFVLHAGPFVVNSIAGGRELIGPEVVLTHRLLKTGAADLVGRSSYAVVTDAAADRFEVPTDAALPLVQEVEHYAPVRLHVFPLGDA